MFRLRIFVGLNYYFQATFYRKRSASPPLLNKLLPVFSNAFSSYTIPCESSELPSWFRFPELPPIPQDDFVIPKTIGVVKTSDLSVVVRGDDDDHHQQKDDHQLLLHEDAEKISRVLLSKNIYEEDIQEGFDSCQVLLSKELVNKVLRRFSNASASALIFFKWAGVQIGYKHDAKTYDVMVDILCKMKQFDEMWLLVEEMDKYDDGLISLVTISKIMRRYAKVGKWKEAVSVFYRMEQFGLRKYTGAMNVLLDALCKERKVEHAREVFLELKSEITPDAHTFNILIHGWCVLNRMDEAESSMEEMQSHGFSPCVVSYTSLIEAYCGQKNFQKVASLIKEMQDKECPPNVITYTIVMHALGKAEKFNDALRIYRMVKEAGCDLDTSFYNSLIYILGRTGRIKGVWSIFGEIIKRGNSPNLTTYNTLMRTACIHLQEEEALRLLKTMQQNSCEIDIQTYHPLLKLLCRRNRMTILSYMIQDMHKKDISLDLGTYVLLIHRLCEVKRLRQACMLFEAMVHKGFIPKRDTNHMLMEELKSSRMNEEMEKVHQQMLRAEGSRKLQRPATLFLT